LRSFFLLSVLAVPVLVSSGLAEPVAAPIPETEIVNRYVSATQEQQTTLRGASMEVDIDAEIPKLNKRGKLHALRKMSSLGKITYRMLGFNGDNTVKNQVIARYLSAEVQAQDGPSLSITPANYKFKYKGTVQGQSRKLYALRVTPRKKKLGLFSGELWLDAETFMPVRESGRLVKSPSVFLKNVQFVEYYAIENGVAVPQRLESRVETRIFGPVKLSINYAGFSKQADEAVEEATFVDDAAQ